MASEAPMSRALSLLGALGDTPELNEMGSGVCVCVYERWTYTAHSSVAWGHAHLRCVAGE